MLGKEEKCVEGLGGGILKERDHCVELVIDGRKY
jgi:hypothetical protein